jgi:hypothetical protein
MEPLHAQVQYVDCRQCASGICGNLTHQLGDLLQVDNVNSTTRDRDLSAYPRRRDSRQSL